MPRGAAPGVDRLTPRERECLRLVGELLQSKEIARRLGIAADTVDERVGSAMRKLGVSSRREAARLLASAEAAQGGLPADTPGDGGPPPLPLHNPRPKALAAEAEEASDVGGERSDAELLVERPDCGVPRDLDHAGGSGAGAGVLLGDPQDRTVPPARDGADLGAFGRLDVRGGRQLLAQTGGAYERLTPIRKTLSILLLGALSATLLGWVIVAAHEAAIALQQSLPGGHFQPRR